MVYHQFMTPAEEVPARSSQARGHREQFTAAHFRDPIIGDLVELIRDKSPGDRLPSERELSERLGVSRTALRDRIGRLEAFGVIERREREGAIYTGLQPERMGEALIIGLISSEIHVESLSAVRHALEREAAILAAKDPDHDGVRAMRRAIKRMNETDDGSEIYDADVDFHEALFVASNSSGLRFLARVLRTVLQGTLRFVTLADERDMVRTVHAGVLDAIEAGDPEQAHLMVDRHYDLLEELFEKDARHRALEQ